MKGIIRKFFFSKYDGQFKVVYFWSTLFLSLTAILIISQFILTIHSYVHGYVPDTSFNGLIGILSGLTVLLIANYNYGKKNRNINTQEESE